MHFIISIFSKNSRCRFTQRFERFYSLISGLSVFLLASALSAKSIPKQMHNSTKPTRGRWTNAAWSRRRHGNILRVSIWSLSSSSPLSVYFSGKISEQLAIHLDSFSNENVTRDGPRALKLPQTESPVPFTLPRSCLEDNVAVSASSSFCGELLQRLAFPSTPSLYYWLGCP